MDRNKKRTELANICVLLSIKGSSTDGYYYNYKHQIAKTLDIKDPGQFFLAVVKAGAECIDYINGLFKKKVMILAAMEKAKEKDINILRQGLQRIDGILEANKVVRPLELPTRSNLRKGDIFYQPDFGDVLGENALIGLRIENGTYDV